MRLDPDIQHHFREVFGDSVRLNEPMSAHTSLRVGGPVDIFAVPRTGDELSKMIAWSEEKDTPCLIIGDGTNLLVKDNGIRGMVIILTSSLTNISITDRDPEKVWVTAMAGARMHALCTFAINNGLAGMNFALGIPGTVGGGLIMNAGTAQGWIENVLHSMKVLMPGGKTVVLEKGHLDFSYRKLSFKGEGAKADTRCPVILEGLFSLVPSDPEVLKKEAQALLKARKANQPAGHHSAGCIFKNPQEGKSAGELIDLAGLKETVVGGAQISPKHANFIINRDGATASDILELMALVQKRVLDRFGTRLEPEVKLVGT